MFLNAVGTYYSGGSKYYTGLTGEVRIDDSDTWLQFVNGVFVGYLKGRDWHTYHNMRIDFKNFNIYTGVAHKSKRVLDVREPFADLIYANVNGIRAHALALRIYGSDEAADYTDEEVKLIREVAGAFCLPGFIDGLEEQLKESREFGCHSNSDFALIIFYGGTLKKYTFRFWIQ